MYMYIIIDTYIIYKFAWVERVQHSTCTHHAVEGWNHLYSVKFQQEEKACLNRGDASSASRIFHLFV